MAPRRRRDDSVGGLAEKGCAKCCAFCRLSPMASAVCYSGVIIGVLTFVLYLFGSGLSQPTEGTSPDALCSDDAPNIGSASVYLRYLQITGFIIFFLILAVPMSCCVCCCLCCNCVTKVQIAGFITGIIVTFVLAAFVVWIILGTFLVIIMNGSYRHKKICLNIQIYVAVMYVYLLCYAIFGLIVLIWKIHKQVQAGGSSSSSPSAADRGAQPDTEKQMKNMQRGAKLMSAVV